MHTLKTPLIIVNFKTYHESSGKSAIELAKLVAEVGISTGVNFAVAVQALDLVSVLAEVKIPVFAQHVDPSDFGSFTGSVVPGRLKEIGAYGSLINHSEKRLDEHSVRALAQQISELGLASVLCVENLEEAKLYADLPVNFIAVEPPELIGGDISVTTADPMIIADSVQVVGEGRLIVGAGVKTGEDILKGLELGAMGFLIASGVCKAENPREVLTELAKSLLR